ncbi:DNA-directed RNA polymerase subunit alpha [Candidatus Giovannonibacteria bacterium RIFCSPLOWO2_02_FULL_45_14]|uniref:DNA-directed RNA polymerase subunit alpha n=1 Tax=Candidatus Giovannonibacteria bacterium RIFCSPLOWO2_12_FULL_44_15 TaxID=1798364 RepID=A0A1F5Y1B9_9BACT|nr:MAG: DNA-directed RNA polymerase subunit alpha [Candidatus Giovannonibacteria bacterium RIFCSPHIGHO2_02_FULL_44_31]OGF75915.1 MAG: DNA-directed RNA polymerase subunit alpha [Candidatus Giovannonibacteria bacterium RIFCSPHIGHO2_12_FULL_44_29]OGF90791.1 MAG: DNA-directed RNA polymerase subunit alpha [Candidatus Giovannonibacteria bacterium RIFCSPLOWO2_02_FULL_45_14]OGF93846.1 MAG: DNA-directed RNA polymerase subunit alpha [Candidatus Giovannonibacteria bacterium RIFCSPLOWO2_12_FULL_44_15]
MSYTISIPSRIRTVSEEENKGVYEIDSLHPGYGHTIGNSLRRVLLSSLPGAAITRVKIHGVSHEFSTIPDVKEDIISLILNLKQVRLLMHVDEPQVIKISAKGVKKVTAGDFETPTQVEVMNKDLTIATLTSKEAKFEIEATVERGLGYIPREVLEKEKAEVGMLTLDAIFTPIKKVNYEVENMRVGDRTDYNRLRILIETDGTINPKHAIEEAVRILVKQLEALVFDEEKVKSEVPEVAELSQEEIASAEAGKALDDEDPLKVRIEDLEFSSRTQNALSGAGIRTVGGLVKKSKEDLLSLQGIGSKAVEEIEEALSKIGQSLKE